MSGVSKNYEYQERDAQIYEQWLTQRYFESKPDHREPYTIVIPPPNVTGILHMGHCLNNTIQDVLVRHARQQGKNACWVPGTDHASIATEAKVVQMLRERGIRKSDLTRDEFLGYAWEWKEKYGGIILQQLKKLGCSLDWSRVNFTMDADYSSSVIKVFTDLYSKGLIYRGKRMINWDPVAKTALSDEEVIMRETQSKLYHLRYAIANEDGSASGAWITIATVRPETILGDTAIAVHPDDERYTHLKGKQALVPLINRAIPIIFDDYVEKDFGTGALKVTPAHDKNDDALGQKHGLQVIDIMNDDGSFSEAAQLYIGEDRFAVRKKITEQLETAGHLVKVEPYTNQVGYSERSDAVVEPRLSMQWWVRMEPLAEQALKVVMEEEIHFHPAKFKNLYRHWMENIKDWCISRQLWWGHRIPAWYDEQGNCFVGETELNARQNAATLLGISQEEAAVLPLRQDEDCLDTWFSSWLWPFEVFDGLSNPGNADVRYYYPTATLVTAPEIIFFWVARMIMAGLEYEKQIPFKDVYFTGIVRDEKGRKMSKSLGNSPDLLALIDKYGADAVRFGILISSPAGNDLLFDVKEESTLKQGSFFVNKMWNALKLIKLWEEKGTGEPSTYRPWANQWFEARLAQVQLELETMMREFRLSEALKTIYSLIWDDFCSWYLEWIKPAFGETIDQRDLEAAIGFYEKLAAMLHPFMPFVTEEIFGLLRQKQTSEHLTAQTTTFIEIQDTHTSLLAGGTLLQQAITTLRDARNKQQLKPKETVDIVLQTPRATAYEPILTLLERQVNARIVLDNSTEAKGVAVTLEGDKFVLQLTADTDTGAQREQLLKDLAYQKGFYESVMRKLGNEKFMANAKPEVVQSEQKKLQDCQARIQAIEAALVTLQ